MQVLRAISPTLALVIILTVTIVLSVAATAWILMYSYQLSTYEAVEILPGSHIDTVNGKAVATIYVINTGNKPALIYKVEIGGITFNIVEVDGHNVTEAYIEADSTRHVIIAEAPNFNVAPYSTYSVKLYSKGGRVIIGILSAKD